MLVRVLDDGGLDASQKLEFATKAVQAFPDFAPRYLFMGDAMQNSTAAIAAYRKGLQLVEEPDLESRLLCALAGKLDPEDPERKELVRRAVQMDGCLVALASAGMMGLTQGQLHPM